MKDLSMCLILSKIPCIVFPVISGLHDSLFPAWCTHLCWDILDVQDLKCLSMSLILSKILDLCWFICAVAMSIRLWLLHIHQNLINFPLGWLGVVSTPACRSSSMFTLSTLLCHPCLNKKSPDLDVIVNYDLVIPCFLILDAELET